MTATTSPARLLAQQLTTRPTQDPDSFTRPEARDVRRACVEFVVLAESRGWTVETIRDGETFCRLLIHGLEDLLSTSRWIPRRGDLRGSALSADIRR